MRSLVPLRRVRFLCAGRNGRLWADRRWGHLDDDVGRDLAVRSCRGCCSVSGPLQTVQRAEFWEGYSCSPSC